MSQLDRFHFICTGNVFRSPIAEAIAKKTGYQASSSGTLVFDRGYKELSWPTIYLAEAHDLTKFLPRAITQTDPASINPRTHVVFISSKNQQRFLEKFSSLPRSFEVWEIADIPNFDQNKNSQDPEIIKNIQSSAEEIYNQILQKLIS